MPTNAEKIQAQRHYLDMLQARYNKTPVLIKIREGGNPDPENIEMELYKWLPYRDVWTHVKEPIYTRGIMPNEVFIDPDTPEWWTMQASITRLLEYCKANNIPFNECAFSGGKGIHVSFLIAGFNIPEDLESRIRSLNVDYMRTIRQAIVIQLLHDTQINPDVIGLDWGKINFSKDGKGSQVRCYGTTRKNGNFKTQIKPDKIPVKPPEPGSLNLKVPGGVQKWDITGTHYHTGVMEALKAECDRVEKAKNQPAKNVQIHGDIQNFPCMRYIIANIPGMEHGRYEAAKSVILLCERLGKSKEEAHSITHEILKDCKHFTPAELELYTNNATTAYGSGYGFSCNKVRAVVGSGGCDKNNCPISQAYREAKKLTKADMSPEPVPVEKWPGCIHNILKTKDPTEDMLILLSAFLGQMGTPKGPAQAIYKQVSDNMQPFDRGYQRLKTSSCDKVREMGICERGLSCINAPSPRYAADKNAYAQWRERQLLSL